MDDSHQWITDLIASEDKSDVELHVEVVHERHTFVIPAHSIVLRCASRVFDTMLEPGKFKEGTTGVAQIKVYGNKVDAVSFIKYLYTKKLQTLDVNAYAALMQTADLYELTTLLMMCEKRIQTGLTPFTVCGMYTSLHNMSSEEFRDFCKVMMLKFAFLIFGEKLHIALPEEAMIFLLSNEKLNVLNEEQVLQATWDWGHCKCILENMVGSKELKDMVANLLPFIRWSDINNLKTRSPLLDLYTHCKKVSISSGLTTERKVENTISLSCFANCLNISQQVDHLNSPTYENYTDGKFTLITFTSDHTVLLTGIKIYLGFSPDFSTVPPFAIYVNTTLIQNLSCKNTVLKKTNALYFYYILTLDFCKPIVLSTNKIHSINLNITDYKFELQKLNLSSSALKSGILGSDDYVSFGVVGQIIAIQKLFYFLQS